MTILRVQRTAQSTEREYYLIETIKDFEAIGEDHHDAEMFSHCFVEMRNGEGYYYGRDVESRLTCLCKVSELRKITIDTILPYAV